MKYFTLKELCHSNVANARGIENKPNAAQELALIVLVDKVLDPLRERFGEPVSVSSGFRSGMLNKMVGGSTTSQHMKGEAADIHAGTREENRELFEIIRRELPFDQLINESDYSWVHVSYRADGRNRNQILKL